jgi:hypothetical protein
MGGQDATRQTALERTGEIDFGATLLEGRRLDRNVGLSSIGSSLQEVHLAASHHEIFKSLKRKLV